MAGPPDPNRVKKSPRELSNAPWPKVKPSCRFNRLSEEWYRQGLTWNYQRKGNIVLFDRHFFTDYYAYDIADAGKQRDVTQRIHGFMLKHVYPEAGSHDIWMHQAPSYLPARVKAVLKP